MGTNQRGRFETLHYKRGLISSESWMNNMALVKIAMDKLPVSARGKAGTFSVSVRSNGQIGFSTSAGKAFGDAEWTAITFDSDTRLMSFLPVADPTKPPKGWTQAELAKVGKSKGDQRYISGAGMLKTETVAYDYSVGTYTFPASNANGKITFTLPKEMAPKAPAARKTKAQKQAERATSTSSTAATAQVVNGPVVNAPVAQVMEDEPELQPAA